MMVKNESKYLEQCLQSLQPIRDAVLSELLIVDTGSEDNTVEIAKRYTDKVYFHEWNHDFSEMRNITISYATGEWVFIIDGDEVMQETQQLIDFLCSDVDKKIGAAAITGKSFTDGNNPNKFSVLITPRLFRRTKKFRYEGSVHNQPMFKGMLIELSASLLHYGYMSTDKELMEKKFARTSVLLKKALEKEPENIYYWYQLSVTYAMHDDFKEALEIIEKGYEIFIKHNRPKSCMFVYTHMAQMYKITRNYIKVEEICLEAFELSDAYIDIHYYLAEARVILGKYQEAIESYLNYLILVGARKDTVKKDTAVIDYTLGNQEMAFFNLANLYTKTASYEKALEYTNKLSKKEDILSVMKNTIFSYIELNRYNELRVYYDNVVEDCMKNVFYEKMGEITAALSNAARVEVAKAFCDVEDNYGILSQMIVEDNDESYSEDTLAKLQRIDFSSLPLFCSDIIYYLVKNRYPLEKLLSSFKEIWFSSLFDNNAKRHDDLSMILYEYLQQYQCTNTINGYKISKMLCRYILILDKVNTNEYKKVFARYIHDGISYLQLIYNPDIIKNCMVYEVKNDEEVFLLYMVQAQLNKADNQPEYIICLRQALEALPIMKKSIESLLNELQAKSTDKKNEFEEYKIMVKDSIKSLIENNELNQAKTVIAEYKSIVPNDIEIILLESKLLLNLTETSSLLN